MSREKGKIAEEYAISFLQQLGFKIISKNFSTIFGEIDIISTKDNVIHFVEVKSGEGFDPIQNITKQKLSKIIKSIDIYFQKNHINNPYCLDVIIIRDKEIDMIENITMFY